MTEKELIELRRWSADVMGWTVRNKDHYWGDDFPDDHYICSGKDVMTVSHWQPDNPSTGQIWQVVQQMKTIDWHLQLISDEDSYFGRFINSSVVVRWEWSNNNNPCIAILMAVKKGIGEYLCSK
jgi:hypothetical protein